MFVVDTNVLIYAADSTSPFHDPCRFKLEQWRRQFSAWHLTWPIVFEFLRVTTHANVVRRPLSLKQSWTFIKALAASPGLLMLVPGSRHLSVAESVFLDVPDLRANLMHDAATAILMREHGVRTIMTRDTDFHRFPFLEVIDPIR